MKKESVFAGTQAEEEKLNQAVERIKNTAGENCNILHQVMFEAQKIYGYLPLEVQEIIAGELGLRLKDVYEAATFYSEFSLVPRGRYHIIACDGTACHMNGSESILEILKEKLDIETGECTQDRMFSLETVHCMGSCGVSPAVRVNDKVFGRMNADKISKLIDDCTLKEKENEEPV